MAEGVASKVRSYSLTLVLEQTHKLTSMYQGRIEMKGTLFYKIA